MPASLTDLPNEVIFQILLHVPPSSTPALQRISRRFNDLAQSFLWKHHCQTQFRYWSQGNDIRDKLFSNEASTDWKQVFKRRHIADRTTSHELDSIIASQLDRIKSSEIIAGLGYDAKDTLLRNLSVGEDAEDVLARRYYSNAVLGHLHRKMAVEEWMKLKDGSPVPLERALAAFDMFVLHNREGDFDDVTACLDRLTQSILTETPEIANQQPRQKALAIAAYLRQNNWTGITDDEQYYHLQNNFIGIALQNDDHPSQTLVSVAIYCCVARRLGLDAQPCGFLFNVIAIIKPPSNRDLDGRVVDSLSKTEPMYMDPFRSKYEVPVGNLRTQLSDMAVAPSVHAIMLDASSTVDMVRRAAINIINSVQSEHQPGDHSSLDPSSPEADSAFYGALWALLLLPDGNRAEASAERARYLPYIFEHLEKQFFMDVGLVEVCILPLFQNQGRYGQRRHTIRAMRDADTRPKPMKERTGETAGKVRYHVGQVFEHKRYHYQAIITGWDLECTATEDWISTMRVAELARGRHQSFYQVLVDDSSVRYVAEDNIGTMQLTVSDSLMSLAGRYFKRWDKSTSTFVSNIKDEYPDD